MEPIKVAETMTPEWFAARSTSIGASEIAAAAGVSPYQTPLELYHRKRGELPPIEDNDPMRMGRLLEPVVKSEFCRVTGLTLSDPNPAMYRHGKYDFLMATPDGIIDDQRLLEAKTASWRMKDSWGAEGSDDTPVQYVCQCAQQMAVMNASEDYLAVLFDGAELKNYKVLRNEELIQILISAAQELWERIKDGRPPEPNWEHSSTPRLIKEIHTSIEDARIELTESECELWSQYERAGELIKRLNAKRESCKAMILHAIGDNFAGILNDGRMIRRKEIAGSTYTVNKNSYIDVRACKCDSGRIIERNKTLVTDGPIRAEVE